VNARTPPIELRYLGRVWQLGEPVATATNTGAGVAAPLEAQASSTAIGTALMRAAHARLDPDPLIVDPWAERLVPEAARAAYRDFASARLASESGGQVTAAPDVALDAMLLASAGFTNVIMRSRYTEDALRDSVERGTRQYVILGAGFDSFALRRPSFAEDVSVFEIDRPRTQALKRRQIEQCRDTVPRLLHFIEADLAKDDLVETLSRSAYRTDAPAFFSWLGVTMFLTREANLATLRAIARCAARGSEVVFTYFDERIFASPFERFRKMQESVRSVGEPFQSGFDPRRLAQDLRPIGLELIEDLSDAQIVERYARGGKDFMAPLDYSRIALARSIG
jgi:methyltransferase (TIGR00027 family)